MNKLFSTLLIIMIILITGCSSSEDKKLEKEPDKKLNLSEVILTYENRDVYIINGYGDVKKIDFSGDDKNPYAIYDDFYFQRVMINPDVPILVNIGKIPDDIIDKIKRIPDVNLTYDTRFLKYLTGNAMIYRCARGNDTWGLTLMQRLGQGGCMPNDENAKAVCKYIDEIRGKFKLY